MGKLVRVIGEWPENNDHQDGGHLFTEAEALFHLAKLVQKGHTPEEAMKIMDECLQEAQKI